MAGLKEVKMESKLLLLSIAAGFLAVALAYFIISEKEKSIVRSMDPVKIIVASKFIPRWSVVTKEMLEYRQIPRRFVTKANVADYKKIKGKMVIAPFVQGEPMLLNKMTEKGGELNTSIPTGLRAVSLSVDEESAVGYMIKPGDFVDVLLTFEVSENKKVYTVAATVLQAVMVIAVGSEASILSKADSYGSLTLALTPEEAEVITFAKEKGRITFALRALGDRAAEKVKVKSFDDLIKQIKKNEKAGGIKARKEVAIEKREE